MTRRTRIALAGLGLWYALGLAHDLLVRQDAWYSLSGGRIDVPYATVRCCGWIGADSDAAGAACDWAFPGGYLSQFLPRRPDVRFALSWVELMATVACAHAIEEAQR